MKKLIFCLVLSLFTLGISRAQQNNKEQIKQGSSEKNATNIKGSGQKEESKKLTIEEKLKKYEGTFQIQVKDMRYKPNIPYNIDELIEKNRKQNETSYVSLGSAVRLMILPSNYVNKSDKKLEMISTFND